MTPERLAEIHEADRRDYTNGQLIRRRPQSAIAQRRELLAHIAELEAERERYTNLWLAGGEAREIHLETTDSHTLRQFQSPVRLTEVLQAAATSE